MSWTFSFWEVVMTQLQGMGQNSGNVDLERTGFGAKTSKQRLR